MRFAKRQTNPIFIEEEGYNWKSEKPLILHVLKISGLTLGLIALVLLNVS